MPPRGSAEVPRVIVGVSRPRKPVVRHVVPFFAGDLTRFATNAYCGIGEETDFDIFLYVIMPVLVCAVRSFANHGCAGAMENGGLTANAFIFVSFNPAVLHFSSCFAFVRVPASASACSERRFFRMNSVLARIFIQEFNERGAARQRPRHDVTGASLGLHDRYVGLP